MIGYRGGRSMAVVLAVLTALLLAATGVAGAAGTIVYGPAVERAVPVTMADGTVLRADVYTPSGPGPFPVLLAQTPYGRADLEAELAYFTERGYLAVAADVRGTGASQGSWSPFAPIEAADGVALVRWAAEQAGSSGVVGLYGGSYLGINQLFTAAAVGPGSPVKAIFPVVAGHDLYRELAAMGGLPNAEFMPLWLLQSGVKTLSNPLREALNSGDPQLLSTVLSLELQHAGGIMSSQVPLLTGLLSGGDEAYDEAYWRVRRPADSLAGIVANGIPAYLVGGWFDLFQRGALMNYAGLQNAWSGRPVGAPMAQGQSVTGRYQLLMGPWYHAPGPEVDLPALQLAWYDRWLKGIDNGIADTGTPLHLYDLGAGGWTDTTAYPIPGATPTRLHLGPGRTGTSQRSANDGSLTPAQPAPGTDWITWTPVNSTCTRSTAQWIGGFIQDPACTESNLARERGPNALVYTSDPMAADTMLAGPIGASIHAQANTFDTQWVVTVTDVGPDGSSRPLTAGALAGSHRQLDQARTWYAPDGSPLMPYHPHTRAAETPVSPNKVTRYDVEVFPTFATIAAGHRIRVVITTADTPHLAPTTRQTLGMLAGVYQVKLGPSSVTLPLVLPAGVGAGH